MKSNGCDIPHCILQIWFIFDLVLLRDNPTERLGYQKGGLKDIMKNK